MGMYFVQIGVLLTLLSVQTFGSERPNVLFVMMDDLRPNVEILRDDRNSGFNSPPMHTPNLDALARKSLVLKSAYVQISICAPSRASLLTGRRPETTRTYYFNHYWREHAGNFTTIPQHFKENGYVTIGMGKIFHIGHSLENHDPISWSMPYYTGEFNHESTMKSWDAIPDELLKDKPLVDQQLADNAIATLRDLATQKHDPNRKPFFLAVGFHKPHLPFVFPASMLEKYPLDQIELPDNPFAPVNMPKIAWRGNHIFGKFKDLRDVQFKRGFNHTVPDHLTRELRRAYYCSVSWADEQLGRVLHELERLEFIDNTIIVFLSDHGYELGEHNLWTKFSNFEIALRTPMMIHIPGRTSSMVQTEQLTEFVDLFPTLVEAAGLERLPVCPEDSSDVLLCTEGTSLLSLISKPDVPVKKAAFSCVGRHKVRDMGYSVRTSRYRYTEWFEFNEDMNQAIWDGPLGKELYDHGLDPMENNNVVEQFKYRNIVALLHRILHENWRKVIYRDGLSDIDLILQDIEIADLQST